MGTAGKLLVTQKQRANLKMRGPPPGTVFPGGGPARNQDSVSGYWMA